MTNMENEIAYTLTDSDVTVIIPSIDLVRTAPRNAALIAELNRCVADSSRSVDELITLLNPQAQAVAALVGSGVKIDGKSVFYRGVKVPQVLADRLRDVVANGFQVDSWKRFVANIMDNPSVQSRDELFLFLEGGNFGITEDGCFLAYKRVTEDYLDCHSRTFDNSVGQTVEMNRADVDTERHRTCSAGLHFCSKSYLRSFCAGSGRIVVVKINPADVVSIPSDYNNAKGRTWKYVVVGEVDTSDDAAKHEWGIVDYRYTDYDEDSYDDWSDEFGPEYDDDESDYDEFVDDMFDDGEHDNATAFVAPTDTPKPGFWGRVKNSLGIRSYRA